MIKKATTIAVALAAVISAAFGQGYPHTMPYQVRPDQFGRGWNVYRNNDPVPYQTIRPDPFSRGYDVYHNGMRTQTIRPSQFNQGWDIQSY
jgi:hypothetical protein